MQPGGLPTEMILYWQKRSRVKGLFLVPAKQLLFQLINTKMDDGYRSTLEVWHTDGFKIVSRVYTPDNRFLYYADEQFLYFVGRAEEDQNPPIEIYEYSFGPQCPVNTSEE